jgi:2,5-diketo-D-gluconate reductase A
VGGVSLTIPELPLNTGDAIPQLGLGTSPLTDAQAADAVVAAAEAGYRHFDTATRYDNEAGVGEGMRRTGIPRDELFVTTKLDGEFQGGDRAIGGLEAALDRMQLDYVDLLLMHWPLPGRGQFVSTWHTFEKLHSDGRARAIGVSNFKPAHIDVLLKEGSIVPAVNQIEINPFVPRDDQVAYDAQHGIVTESWSPLGGGGAEVLSSAQLAPIAAAHSRTVGQVVLRWHVQRGLVPLPRSRNAARIAENAAVFDFALTDDDMTVIAGLARPGTGVDSDRTGH